MSNPPLAAAIEASAASTAKLADPADVEVQAPEWAVRDPSGTIFVARMAGAVGLVVVALLVLHDPLGNGLPGETASSTSTQTFAPSAANAADDAASRQSAADVQQQEAAADQVAAVDAQTAALDELRQAETERAEATDPAQRKERLLDAAVQNAGREYRASKARVETANRAVTDAADEWTVAAGARQAALDFLLASTSPRTTDADLVRVLVIGAFVLLSLLGAVALAVPRPSGPLTYRLNRGAAGTSDGSPPPGPGAPARKPSSASKTVTTASDEGKSDFVSREPVVTQAGITAAALIAGLFGIQNTEGLSEAVINVLLPAIPVVGAFFARRRVWAKANLSTTPSDLQTRPIGTSLAHGA